MLYDILMMVIYMNNGQKLMKEICDEKNISYKLVSKDWVAILQKDDKVRYIVGYKFPLNNQAVGKICDDKYAIYEVMKEFNVPVAEHHILFKNYDQNEIINYANKYNYNMVVKSNTGTCGNDMYKVNTKDEMISRIDELLKKNFSISVSPYYDIKTEYRSIMFNGNVELVYGKKRPIVIGNGINTIYELLCEFNERYFKKINADNLNRVLNKGEVFEYNWQFNLSKGSMPFLLEEYIKENEIKVMAQKIAAILDLKFASVDIIELTNGSYLLLEVNSGVMMENISESLPGGREIAKNIYTKAIDEMFK